MITDIFLLASYSILCCAQPPFGFGFGPGFGAGPPFVGAMRPRPFGFGFGPGGGMGGMMRRMRLGLGGPGPGPGPGPGLGRRAMARRMMQMNMMGPGMGIPPMGMSPGRMARRMMRMQMMGIPPPVGPMMGPSPGRMMRMRTMGIPPPIGPMMGPSPGRMMRMRTMGIPPPVGPMMGPSPGKMMRRMMKMQMRAEMMNRIPPPVPPPMPAPVAMDTPAIPPPVPPPRVIPAPVAMGTPAIPPPIPPPPRVIPAPIVPAVYTAEMQRFVTSINTHTSVFRQPGQSYDQVVGLLQQFYGRRSNMQYNAQSMRIPSFNDRTELSANARIAPFLYETDMVLTVAQARRLLGQSRFKRKMTTQSRWATVVPYRFAVTDDVPWQGLIRQALQIFERNTCIRFQENGAGSDYLSFNQGEGCYSSVGRLGGSQEISIGYGCEKLGVICHEIAHSLGFWHEQARSDRDSYISVNLGNVIKGAEGQFEIKTNAEASSYGIQYDYGSLMHYSRNAFARQSNLNTIEPRDNAYIQTIGTRLEPSFLDFKLLNQVMCNGICTNSLPCQHKGYPDPNNCAVCKCPEGLAGTFCERVKSSNCGREIVAAGQWQELRYSGTMSCYWRIRSPSNGKIRFEYTSVNYKCAQSSICEEFVETKYDVNHDRTGYRQCCKVEQGQKLSAGSDILIISRATQQSQFILRYRAEGVSQVVTPQPRSLPAQPPSGGVFLAWSMWSGCTENCGACGTRTRSRTCTGGVCSGSATETQVCNQRACQEGTTLRGKRSVLQDFDSVIHNRTKRAGPWCCATFTLTNGNWCTSVDRRRRRG